MVEALALADVGVVDVYLRVAVVRLYTAATLARRVLLYYSQTDS